MRGDAGLASHGFDRWTNRASSFFALAAVWPAWLLAANQVPSQRPAYLLAVGGALLVVVLAGLVLSWFGRGHWAARAFALVVAVGVLTWPLSWTSSAPPDTQPWLWMFLGLASVWASAGFGIRPALWYCVGLAVAFAMLRMLPSGGQVSFAGAMQDALTLVSQAAGILIGLDFLQRACRELDGSVGRTQAAEANAAMEAALLDERRVLDGVIHDQVMTCLVAAAHGADERRSDVSALAGQALSALDRIGAQPEEAQAPVIAPSLRQLLADVVASVGPNASFDAEIPDPRLRVPQGVSRAMAQATREAVANAERHARAEHIGVHLRIAPLDDAGGARVEVEISDDGIGFDRSAVDPRRLGIRVSLIERMEVVAGQARVWSAPGEGTSVQLAWSGTAGAAEVSAPAQRRAEASLLEVIASRPLVWLTAGLIGLQLAIGLASLEEYTSAGPVWLAFAASLGGTAAVLWRPDARRLAVPAALLAALSVVTVTSLVTSVLPPGWPGYATWFASYSMILLTVLVVRGHDVLAWITLAAYAVLSVIWARAAGIGYDGAVRVIFGPLLWMVLGRLTLRALVRLSRQYAVALTASWAAAIAAASSFSALVRREVWVTQVSALVRSLLLRIVNDPAPLTDDERARCLLLEARLRDQIGARNLHSLAVAEATQDARVRGVNVTMIDNRDADLPEELRRTALKQLEETIRSHPNGRIVARTAPIGYREVVTILSVGAGGLTRLTKVLSDGTVETSD